MEFIKNLFKDDETIVGLCGFKDKNAQMYIPQTKEENHAPKAYYNNLFAQNYNKQYQTNTKNNFLLG